MRKLAARVCHLFVPIAFHNLVSFIKPEGDLYLCCPDAAFISAQYSIPSIR